MSSDSKSMLDSSSIASDMPSCNSIQQQALAKLPQLVQSDLPCDMRFGENLLNSADRFSQLWLGQSELPDNNTLSRAIAIHCQHCWHQWGKFIELATDDRPAQYFIETLNRIPRLNDYLDAFNLSPKFLKNHQVLVEQEYYYRNHYGDGVSAEYYEIKYGIQVTPIPSITKLKFQPNANQLSPQCHQFDFVGEISIGRQRRGEPQPTYLTSSNLHQRLIIARRDENLVSRYQMMLQRLSPIFVAVTNTSEQLPLRCQSRQIPPGEQRLIKLPAVISIVMGEVYLDFQPES